MRDLFETIQSGLSGIPLLKDAPLKNHTTFGIGGPADVLALPRTEDELNRALAAARALFIPYFVIGNGSNLLVRDGGFRGLVISMKNLARIDVDGERIHAQSGALLPKIAARALKEGLSGLEFASGIPGSLGGAVRMNAGAYAEQMADVVAHARVLRGGETIILSNKELCFGYRTSAIREGDVVLGAELLLQKADPTSVSRKMDDLNARRREKQPLSLPSAGSTFKRPSGHFAGALIEGAGLKGLSVGGAQVSEKHAGFIVNAGGATARDVLDLILRIQTAVFEQTGVVLETEVHVIGED